ncbi:Ferric enterobactin transport ATP-binding protein FepC (TC 3.A.1.14.2) [Klebsiella aerogenes]|nr:Ferric enterobactin transport ATP-binding protein FepC (TC 3.A.1.14.2) [Klebsiella aerogenes]
MIAPSRRLIASCLLLMAASLLVSLLGLAQGPVPLTIDQVFSALFGDAPRNVAMVVNEWRLPRVLMALLIGAALGVSGAIFQSLTRNPLGSPDVMGFNTGAWSGVLVAMVLFGQNLTAIALAAMAGGVLTSLVVWLLAWRNGIETFRLIIIGIGVRAMLVAFNTWLLLRASLETALSAGLWNAGSLNGLTWGKTWPSAPLILLMLVGSALLVRRMRLLEMGRRYRLRAGGAGRAFAPAADAGGGGAHRRLDGAGRADLIYRAGGAAYRPPPERHGPLGTDPVGPVRRAAAGAGRLRRPTAVYAVAAAGWRVNRQPRRYLPYCIVDSGVPQKMSAVPSRLRGEQLTLAYGNKTIAESLNVTIPDGHFTAIIGPNGCGKSTLLRTLSRLMTPASGHVWLDGAQIQQYASKEVARRIGLLAQNATTPGDITVQELVARGRYPHQPLFTRWRKEDEEAVNKAMRATGISDLALQSVDTLSGGQRQRAWIAMVLAQETAIMLLDEPTTWLDISHQIDLLELLSELNREKGYTLAAVLHDLNQACRYATHLIALRDGRIVAEGAPKEIVTADLIERIYGLRCTIIEDPVAHTPLVVPLGRR